MLKKIINLLKRIKLITKDFEIKLDVSYRSNYLLNSALTSTESLIVERQADEKELIVSFTTYSKRIHDVHLVIESLAQQTVQPNRLLLWLDEDEFTLDTIPLILKKQIKRGLEVRFCPNYRSYKKLIPTLQYFPDANVITIDDDTLYPHDTVEMLCREHALFPDYVLGNRAHKIKVSSDGKVLPYQKWDYETSDNKASLRIVPIGVGGVFYPARILGEECLNVTSFTHLAPHADDMWFKTMSLLNKVKCKKVNDNRDFSRRFLLLEDNQDIGLFNSNFHESANDTQIKNLFEQYNITV